MAFLIASVAVLAAGPLTYYFAERSHWAIRVLEALVVIAVGALLLLHILPETIAQVGWVALVPMILGLLGPTFVERALGSIERQAHVALVLLVLCGLGIHALMDGVALVLPTHEEGLAGLSLPIVVVLHRIPVSLLIWWLLRPSYGLWAATLALCIEGLGAVVGFFAAHALVTHINSPVVGFVQAFVAGSMLHVMVDRRHHGVESPH